MGIVIVLDESDHKVSGMHGVDLFGCGAGWGGRGKGKNPRGGAKKRVGSLLN